MVGLPMLLKLKLHTKFSNCSVHVISKILVNLHKENKIKSWVFFQSGRKKINTNKIGGFLKKYIFVSV